MFTFDNLEGKHRFGQIWTKTSTFSVSPEVWYQDEFRYPEFNGAIHIFSFRWETPFFGKFGPKNEKCQFQFKYVT